MASEASTLERNADSPRLGILSGRQGRLLRENLTAYLFLLPAMSLIFVFGLFPVAFSLYVSLYRWRIRQGDYVGLGNYMRALDELAYVAAFGLAVGALYLTALLLWRTWQMARQNQEQPWLLAVPGILLALSMLQFIRYFALALPEILAIGEKVQRLERTREIFLQFLTEALQVEAVAAAQQQLVLLLILTVIVIIATQFFVKTQQNLRYLNRFFLIALFGVSGWVIGQFTLQNLQAAYVEAQESGESIAIWTHVVLVTGGALLLYASWRLWQSASNDTSTSSRPMLFKALASLALLCGAWIFIAELPSLIEAGDEDMWNGLATTAWFSLGTVPLQLALGLGIAYLLYQNIRGKSFFRMVYFLPYITPAVAAAAVFRIIFSNRPSGMMNQVWTIFGAEPLNWLLEPGSIFNIGGFQGPSLALVVIILFSVWTYSGYNAVIFLAGLGGIPSSLYEAAQIDGANRWQVFRHVTLPLLSPITYFLSLLGVIGTFKAFNSVYVLRNPSALDTVDTMSLVIWDTLKVDNRYGYAATLAFVLFAVVLVLTLINNNVQGRRVFYG